jgi:5,10-methylenetetrahydromethanopterin reductase
VTSGIEVSIRVPLGHPIPELAAFAKKCEDAGLAGVGIPDHHHTGRDSYLALGAMAHATRTVRLFPATSNTVTRHPLVLASLANSLDEIAPGRTMITVGPGFLSVEKAGLAPDRRARLTEVVRTLRELLHAGTSEVRGHRLNLTNFPGEHAEVAMLASGPKMLEAAGASADTVMMLVGLHPAGVAAAREHIRRGAVEAGRDPAGIQEIFIVPFDTGDPEELRRYPQGWFREGKPWLEYPSRSTRRWLTAAGFDLPEPFDPGSVSDRQADDILDALGAFGSPEQCADRLLRARDEIGVKRVFLFPGHTWANHYQLPERHIGAFASTIGPRLAQG